MSKPAKGSRWMSPGTRGVWTVVSVGSRYVTLKPSIPWVSPSRIDLAMWPGGWVPA